MFKIIEVPVVDIPGPAVHDIMVHDHEELRIFPDRSRCLHLVWVDGTHRDSWIARRVPVANIGNGNRIQCCRLFLSIG